MSRGWPKTAQRDEGSSAGQREGQRARGGNTGAAIKMASKGETLGLRWKEDNLREEVNTYVDDVQLSADSRLMQRAVV